MNTGHYEKFWDFSVRTYRTEGVPASCLALQDENGADVNYLLFCCWYGSMYGPFTEGFFESSLAFSQEWAVNVVVPLRQVRTWMKHHGCTDARVAEEACMQLRERIKGVEFRSEQMQEEMLQELAGSLPGPAVSLDERLNAATGNLRRYCEAMDIDINPTVSAHLYRILVAAFPQESAERIRSLLVA